ncbi:MAG: phosphoglycerate kinase [Thermoanaerobaculia bacterium]
MSKIPVVDELELDGARVFYRVDYNVPLEGGEVGDVTRIEGTIPTLHLLRERGAKVIIASHLGRPKGQRNEKYSLAPVREKLAEILGRDVKWASDCVGEEAERLSAELSPGEILLLENLRFHPGEEKNDQEFAKGLRKLADYYVNDAFGASHRAHASIVALPELFPANCIAGGLLLAKELEFLERVVKVEESDRPFVAVLGGAKIAGKIEPLEAMVKIADTLLIGGGMANTFLAARGVAMGASLVDADSLEIAKRLLEGKSRATIILPQDVVVTDSLDAPTAIRTLDVEAGLDPGQMAVDIGMRTVMAFDDVIAGAKTLFWNGPMGVFEREQFAEGTRSIAKAVAQSDAISIVGGGESVEAVKESGYADRISHISTGGGASLEFISGASLPGVEVLRKAANGAGD